MDIFYAIADPTRRSILEIIATYGQLSASEIFAKFQVSSSAISQHLKVLREARLVNVERLAQRRIYRINQSSISEVERWTKQLHALHDARFNRLEKLLAKERLDNPSK